MQACHAEICASGTDADCRQVVNASEWVPSATPVPAAGTNLDDMWVWGGQSGLA